MIRVFVSYSHDSPEHEARVLSLADQLVGDGIDCILDQYEDSPPEGWPKWMDRNINMADYVLLVCTATYYSRAMDAEKRDKGLGVKWESTLTYQHIYDAGGHNTRFIPVVFQAADVKYIPKPIRGSTLYCLDTEQGYEVLYRRLSNQPRTTKPVLGKVRRLPRRNGKQKGIASVPAITLSRIPSTGRKLIGRENELDLLSEAWGNPNTNAVFIIASGG